MPYKKTKINFRGGHFLRKERIIFEGSGAPFSVFFFRKGGRKMGKVWDSKGTNKGSKKAPKNDVKNDLKNDVFSGFQWGPFLVTFLVDFWSSFERFWVDFLM